ncbi:hypothetical protein VE02_05987 [Pseudogymnoascus sp. 03VT05]|nr:hypothetical protein VE02_05987 [Pseudogymnoascus sp. 03VT05]
MSDNLSIFSLSEQKWKSGPLPPELLHSLPGTSHDIEGILESSIEQLQALHKLEDRQERQRQLAGEKGRLERQRLSAEENSFQQQQELHLLSILKERSEREFTATGSNLQRQQQRAAEERNVSASKGKEKSTQEPQENVPNVDSQPAPSRRGFGNDSGGQSSVIAPPPQTQGHMTSTPEQSAAPTKSPAAAMVSLPVREAPQRIRSVFRRNPPAYAESSSAAAARQPAATKGSSTSVRSPPSDVGSSSSRKWGLRLLRPYMTTVFKPRSRSNRATLSKPTSEPTPKTVECVSCMEDFGIEEM